MTTKRDPRLDLLSQVLFAGNVFQRVGTRCMYAPHGLSSSQHVLLALLAEAGEPLAVTELACRAHVIKQATSQAIERLRTQGLVRRVPDARDRRFTRVELTPAGKQLVDAVHTASQPTLERMLQGIPLRDRQRSIEILRRLVANCMALDPSLADG